MSTANDIPPDPSIVPVSLIIDTDMGNDVDDALALAMAHALERRGACRLLAVTLTNPEPDAGVYIDALNRQYGRPDIPIGVSPDAPFVSASKYLSCALVTDPETGARVYPSEHDVTTAPRSLELLRRMLADAPDQSVVLAQIGFFTNFATLLESPSDDISPLPGLELVRRKVRLLSLMAGAFQTAGSNNHMVEFNVRFAIAPAQKLAAAWPTPIIWSGWEVGDAIRFPATAVNLDYIHTRRHLLPESYQAYNPTPHEPPTWDLTTVLHAVYPDRDYFGFSSPGQVTVEDDGYTRFTPSEGGRDRFMTVTPVQASRLRGLFEALCTEPFPA